MRWVMKDKANSVFHDSTACVLTSDIRGPSPPPHAVVLPGMLCRFTSLTIFYESSGGEVVQQSCGSDACMRWRCAPIGGSLATCSSLTPFYLLLFSFLPARLPIAGKRSQFQEDRPLPALERAMQHHLSRGMLHYNDWLGSVCITWGRSPQERVPGFCACVSLQCLGL